MKLNNGSFDKQISCLASINLFYEVQKDKELSLSFCLLFIKQQYYFGKLVKYHGGRVLLAKSFCAVADKSLLYLLKDPSGSSCPSANFVLASL